MKPDFDPKAKAVELAKSQGIRLVRMVVDEGDGQATGVAIEVWDGGWRRFGVRVLANGTLEQAAIDCADWARHQGLDIFFAPKHDEANNR